MKKSAKRLAYMVNCFPSLTTTFVYREVDEVRRQGVDISVFSIHRPSDRDLSPESRGFLAETYYLLPARPLRFLGAHFGYLLQRPITYMRVVCTALFRSGGPRDAWRSLMHFMLAAYVAKAMEEREVGHIHAHFASNAASVAMFAARLLNIGFSFTAHAFDLFQARLLLKEKVRAAEFAIAISEYNRRFLAAYVPRAAEKIKVVHCGVDPSEYCPAGRAGVVRKPEIISIGQLVEKKGFPYLLQALQTLAAQGLPFRCTLIGDGYQRERLTRMLAEYELKDRVHITGAVYQELARSYLRVADIFVLPCVVAENEDRDGIPVALIEAMAMGVPVVSTTVSGIPELVQHGESGLLVAERDVPALAGALRQLLMSSELRRSLGANGRQRVIKEFNASKSALELKTLFESRLPGASCETLLSDGAGGLPLAEAKGG